MTAEERPEVAETVAFSHVEIAEVCQNRIEVQAAMFLAQDEPIALGLGRIGGIAAQKVVLKHPDDLDQERGRIDMAPPAVFDSPKD
jgi:hypothetical protein